MNNQEFRPNFTNMYESYNFLLTLLAAQWKKLNKCNSSLRQWGKAVFCSLLQALFDLYLNFTAPVLVIRVITSYDFPLPMGKESLLSCNGPRTTELHTQPSAGVLIATWYYLWLNLPRQCSSQRSEAWWVVNSQAPSWPVAPHVTFSRCPHLFGHRPPDC